MEFKLVTSISQASYTFKPNCLIGLGRTNDGEDEVELYQMVVMAELEQIH